MAARWTGTFDLAELLEAAKIPPPQLAILQSSQAWRSVDRGDELQSAPRAPEPVHQKQRQQVQQKPAIQHPMQLFDGLVEPQTAAAAATTGPAAAGAPATGKRPVQQHEQQQQQQQHQALDADAQPDSPAQLFAGLDAVPALARPASSLPSSQLHQTVSEAHVQVAGLVSSLYDSPSTGKPLAALSPRQAALPLKNPARPGLQLAAAVAATPSEEEVAIAVRGAVDQAAAAALVQAPVPGGGAAREERTAAAVQTMPEPGAPAPAVFTVEVPPPEQAWPHQSAGAQEQPAGPQDEGGGGGQEGEEQWADAAAVLLGASQGDEDFQDAEEGAAGEEAARQGAAAEAGLGGSQPPPGEGLLLTQAPLSPSGFAFATQLPDSAGFAMQLPEDGLLDPRTAPGAETAATPPPQRQQQRQQQRRQQHNHLGAGQQLQQHCQTASEEHSLQGSAGHGGDGADSGASRPRSGQSWLLSPLGALAQVFKRNANQAKQGAGGPFLTQAPTQLPGHDTSPAAAAGSSYHQPVGVGLMAPSVPRAGAAAAMAAHLAAQPALLPSQCVGAGGDLLSALPSQRMLHPSALPSSRIPRGVKSPPHVQQAAPSASAWNAKPAARAAGRAAETATEAVPTLVAAAVVAAADSAAAPARAAGEGLPQRQAQPAGAMSPPRPPEALIPAFTGESPGVPAGGDSGEEDPGSSGGQSGIEDVTNPQARQQQHHHQQQGQQQLSPRLAAQPQPEQGRRTPRAVQSLQQQKACSTKALPQPLQPPPPQQGVQERRLSGGFLDILTRIASPLPLPSKPGSPLSPGNKPVSPPSALELPPGTVHEPAVAAEVPAAAEVAASAAPAASADRTVARLPAATDAAQDEADVQMQEAEAGEPVAPAPAGDAPGSAPEPACMLGEASATIPPTQLVLPLSCPEEGPEQTSPARLAPAAVPEPEALLAKPAVPAASADLMEEKPAMLTAAPAAEAEASRLPGGTEGKPAGPEPEQGPASAAKPVNTAGGAAAQEALSAEAAVAPGTQQQQPAATGVEVKQEPQEPTAAAPPGQRQPLALPSEAATAAASALQEAAGGEAQADGTASAEQWAGLLDSAPHAAKEQALEPAAAVQAAFSRQHVEPKGAAPAAVTELATEAAAGGLGQASEAAPPPAVEAAAEAEPAPPAAEGSPPEEALPTLQPPPSQWPESLLRERVPPTPAGGGDPSPRARAPALAPAAAGRDLKPATAVAASGAAAAARGEDDGKRSARPAAAPSGSAAPHQPQQGGLQRQMLAALDAEVQAAAAELAAQEQALLAAVAEAGPQAAAAALGAAALGVAMEAGQPGPVPAGRAQLSFPVLHAGVPSGAASGRLQLSLVGAKRPRSAAGQHAVGDLVDECRGPDVAQLLLQRSKRPRPAPQEQRQPLGLRRATEDAEAEMPAEGEEAAPLEPAAQAAHVAVQAPAASSGRLAEAQTAQAGRPPPRSRLAHSSAQTSAALPDQQLAAAQTTEAGVPVQPSRLAHAGVQMAAALEQRTGAVQAGKPQLKLVAVTSGVQTAGPPTAAAGAQTSPGIGMVATGAQAAPPLRATVDAAAQLHMVPLAAPAAAAAAQAGSPHLAHGTAGPGSSRPTPAAVQPVVQPPVAVRRKGAAPSRLARPPLVQHEWEDGLMRTQLPAEHRPTRVVPDLAGMEAARQRAEQARQEREEQQRQQNQERQRRAEAKRERRERQRAEQQLAEQVQQQLRQAGWQHEEEQQQHGRDVQALAQTPQPEQTAALAAAALAARQPAADLRTCARSAEAAPAPVHETRPQRLAQELSPLMLAAQAKIRAAQLAAKQRQQAVGAAAAADASPAGQLPAPAQPAEDLPGDGWKQAKRPRISAPVPAAALQQQQQRRRQPGAPTALHRSAPLMRLSGSPLAAAVAAPAAEDWEVDARRRMADTWRPASVPPAAPRAWAAARAGGSPPAGGPRQLALTPNRSPAQRQELQQQLQQCPRWPSTVRPSTSPRRPLLPARHLLSPGRSPPLQRADQAAAASVAATRAHAAPGSSFLHSGASRGGIMAPRGGGGTPLSAPRPPCAVYRPSAEELAEAERKAEERLRNLPAVPAPRGAPSRNPFRRRM